MFNVPVLSFFFFFFFTDTATTEIYTLSLHDALPISAAAGSTRCPGCQRFAENPAGPRLGCARAAAGTDRKSTRLNSSHANISYAVFCLKKKKKKKNKYSRRYRNETSYKYSYQQYTTV